MLPGLVLGRASSKRERAASLRPRFGDSQVGLSGRLASNGNCPSRSKYLSFRKVNSLSARVCVFSRACVTCRCGQVPEYLKRQKEPDQLAALLQMLQCLLNNKHFAFLEIYVSDCLDKTGSTFVST